MYCSNDITKEGNPILRVKCERVRFPLTSADKECIKQLYEYMVVSENPDLTNQYKIRPGVGIAAPQVGVAKRMFAMDCTDFLDENQKKYMFAVINPEIIATSDLMVYLPDREGCLSVDRNTEGLVTPRHYKIVVKFAQYDTMHDKIRNVKMTLEGYPAIVFQHEYDHLDGIMYVDKMFKVKDLDPKILPLYTLDENAEEESEEQK
ncbi:MAG: peptide deformylase [Acholeplasmatales bacterium]|nr:peptide deformylase [Acholeplasmatales bacterium]